MKPLSPKAQIRAYRRYLNRQIAWAEEPLGIRPSEFVRERYRDLERAIEAGEAVFDPRSDTFYWIVGDGDDLPVE